MIIGPEGGLSDIERQTLIDNQFTLISLGPHILRTETAAISSNALLQSIYDNSQSLLLDYIKLR